jgi:hypothetical protein
LVAKGALDLTFAYENRGKWAANVKSAPLVGIDLSARHGMKAGDWGRRQDLSRIRLN